MRDRINRPVLELGARWVFAKKIIANPVLRRSDWSRNKASTAVWTDVTQDSIDAGGAKRALVATDTRFKGVRRQRLVAVLASWSEFKHGASIM